MNVDITLFNENMRLNRTPAGNRAAKRFVIRRFRTKE